MSLYKYFSPKELACRCGNCDLGEHDMDTDFMRVMTSIREELGFALPVTSAIRCAEHNNKVSSTGLTGAHTTGRAIDIAVSHENAYLLLETAFHHGMTGIGVKQKGDGRFIHLDMIFSSKRPRVWSYG